MIAAAVSERGSTMVEYALVLPLYLCLLLGVVNASLFMFIWNGTAYAARAATRYAVTHGSTASHVCTSTEVRNLAITSIPGLSNATVTTTWTPDNTPGSTVRVVVKLNFTTFVPLVHSQALALASSSQMTVIQ